MTDVCIDLKNIKYQTMLLNSNAKVDSDKINTPNVADLLNEETTNNKKKPWNKLGQTERRKKVELFIDEYLPKSKQSELKNYLEKCLTNKKLQRTKDVIYDAEKGLIKSIPGLTFDKNKKRFTLKRVDKKNSTLKSLPMKHRKKTQKKKALKEKKALEKKDMKKDMKKDIKNDVKKEIESKNVSKSTNKLKSCKEL